MVEHICHHFWLGATANPPKSDDRCAQLTRGAFIINDFLQNPHFSLSDDCLMFWPSFGTCHDTVNQKINLIRTDKKYRFIRLPTAALTL